MKNIFSFFLVSLLISNDPFCQSVGISVGYGGISMAEVNQDLVDDHNLFAGYGALTSYPDKVNNSFFFEGTFKFGLGSFNLGITGYQLSSQANYTYRDASGYFSESYEVSTLEVLGLFEVILPSSNIPIQPFIQLAGGVGFADAEQSGIFIYYPDASYNIDVRNTVDGSYFAARIKAGLGLHLNYFVIDIGAGYRFADSGILKGKHNENGFAFINEPVYDIDGNEIGFDYSGFFISSGVSFLIH